MMMMTLALAPALVGCCFSDLAIWHSEKSKEAFGTTYAQPNHEGASYDSRIFICTWCALQK